jgi:hypothetical protein
MHTLKSHTQPFLENGNVRGDVDHTERRAVDLQVSTGGLAKTEKSKAKQRQRGLARKEKKKKKQ